MSRWTAADVPDQTGRVAIITGSNTGIGYGAAAVLADKGAHTVLAVRNLDKGNEAVERIKAASPNATVTVQQLDLTSLDDIRKAADELRANFPRIDLLINNAGVRYTDKASTKDGFELQFGANHLHHCALTGQLLDNMLPVEGSRVVTISSIGHRIRAKIHFDDLNLDRNYNRVVAYGQSKLANLLFTYELARRLTAKGAPTIATAAHPGAADTDLLRNIPGGIRQLSQFFWTNFIAQKPTWERNRHCAPRPTRPHRTRSTTARAASANSAATRKSLSPAHSRTMRISSAGYGPSPRS